MLKDVKNGSFAKRFIDDQDAGGPAFKELRAKDEQHPSETTGRELRKLKWWVKSHDSDYSEATATRSDTAPNTRSRHPFPGARISPAR